MSQARPCTRTHYVHSHRRIQQGHPADQPVSVPAKATTLSEMMWSKNQDTSASIRAPPPLIPPFSSVTAGGTAWNGRPLSLASTPACRCMRVNPCSYAEPESAWRQPADIAQEQLLRDTAAGRGGV